MGLGAPGAPLHGEICAPERYAIDADIRRAGGLVPFGLQCKTDLGGGFPTQAL